MDHSTFAPVGMAKAAAVRAATLDKAPARLSTTPEERAEWVRLFEESGKSAAEFCKELGLAETTFAAWRKQAREPANGAGLTFTEVPQAMVDAVLATNGSPAAAVTIYLPNGTRLDVAAGTDAAWLAQLLVALRP